MLFLRKRKGAPEGTGQVTKDMLIGEIISEHPEAMEILTACGMHCIGCPSAQMESLEDACKVHGLNADEVLKSVNTHLGVECA